MTKFGRRRRFRKHIGSLAIVGVMVLMLIFVFVAGVELRAQNESRQARIQEIEMQIAEEEQKAKEIDEYRKYVQTKKFAEEIAIDRLGLVYPGQIIFKAK